MAQRRRLMSLGNDPLPAPHRPPRRPRLRPHRLPRHNRTRREQPASRRDRRQRAGTTRHRPQVVAYRRRPPLPRQGHRLRPRRPRRPRSRRRPRPQQVAPRRPWILRRPRQRPAHRPADRRATPHPPNSASATPAPTSEANSASTSPCNWAPHLYVTAGRSYIRPKPRQCYWDTRPGRWWSSRSPARRSAKVWAECVTALAQLMEALVAERRPDRPVPPRSGRLCVCWPSPSRRVGTCPR